MARDPGGKWDAAHQDPSGPEGHEGRVKRIIKHAETHGTTAHHDLKEVDHGFPHMGKGEPPGDKY